MFFRNPYIKRKVLIIVAVFFCITIGFSQQYEQYSLYSFNKHEFNPAYAGMQNTLVFTGVVRGQWIGLTGLPFSQNFNVHMPLYIVRGGIGISLRNDFIGAEKNSLAALSYAYYISTGRDKVLSLSIRLGMVQKTFEGAKLRTQTGQYSDDIIFHNDIILPDGVESRTAPVLGAGIYYQTHKFEIGVAIINVLEEKLNYENFDFRQKRNFFLNFATKIDILNSITLSPSIFVKSDLLNTQIDFSAIIRYSDNIFFGGTFRGYHPVSIDAFVMIAGYRLTEKLMLAYSYDISLSTLKTVSKGSHEFMLTYNLTKPIGNGRLPEIIFNPRHL